MKRIYIKKLYTNCFHSIDCYRIHGFRLLKILSKGLYQEIMDAPSLSALYSSLECLYSTLTVVLLPIRARVLYYQSMMPPIYSHCAEVISCDLCKENSLKVSRSFPRSFEAECHTSDVHKNNLCSRFNDNKISVQPPMYSASIFSGET